MPGNIPGPRQTRALFEMEPYIRPRGRLGSEDRRSDNRDGATFVEV